MAIALIVLLAIVCLFALFVMTAIGVASIMEARKKQAAADASPTPPTQGEKVAQTAAIGCSIGALLMCLLALFAMMLTGVIVVILLNKLF